ncbi:MAG: TAXI family TRAP transporter solute-binding subunit [Gammaproteobacteria bacterium]
MRVLLIAAGFILTMGLPLATSQAEGLQFFRIGTGGIAGTYYPIGGMIAQAISNPSGARPCEQGGSCGPPGVLVIAQSANGSVANVKDIQRGSLESGFVQSDVAYWAYTGTGTFEGEAPIQELRTIANLYAESIHIVVRKGAGIRSVRDLAGKRVSLDEPGSGTLIDAEIVLSEYGITREDIKVEYMKPDLAIKRIRDNKLDAFFIVAGYPARAVSELAADAGAQLLPIDGPEAERLVTRNRFFSRDIIPKGVYSGISETKTISVGAQWLVAASVDTELVYQITRALWNQNSRKLLDNGHAKGKSITLETALDGIAVPLHAGAKRFYDEIGMSVE